MPDSTCPALLWILARASKHFAYGAITLFRLVFQKTSAMFVIVTLLQVRTPRLFLILVWAVTLSLAATKAIADLLSFPTDNEMFQFSAFPLLQYVFV